MKRMIAIFALLTTAFTIAACDRAPPMPANNQADITIETDEVLVVDNNAASIANALDAPATATTGDEDPPVNP